MGAAPARVAIIDDHEVVALAIAAFIADAPALEFAGNATSARELIASGSPPDLVVLDLSLRDGSSPAQNVALLRAWGAHVLVLTSGDNPFLMREAARADVLGIVRKSAPAAAILAAITAAAGGSAVVTTDWAATLDSDLDLSSGSARTPSTTTFAESA